MSKIAINTCFGGFSISEEAVRLGRHISGNPRWGGPALPGDVYTGGKAVDYFYGGARDIDRQDPTLIAVIEQLGDRANGPCASIELVDLKAGQPYRIEAYDGTETIMMPDEIKWSFAV